MSTKTRSPAKVSAIVASLLCPYQACAPAGARKHEADDEIALIAHTLEGGHEQDRCKVSDATSNLYSGCSRLTCQSSRSEPIELSDSSETDSPQVSTSRAASNKNGSASNKSTPKASSKAATSNSNGKRKAILESDSDDVKPAKKRASLGGASKPVTAARKKSSKVVDSEDDEEDYKDDDLVDEDDDDNEADDVSSEEEEDVKPKKKAPASKKATPAKKPAPAKKAPAAKPPSKTSTSKASSSKTKVEDEDEEPKPKPKWIPKGPSVALNPGMSCFRARYSHTCSLSAQPIGTKIIPDGAPDALGGLTIVFTGELESLGRDEATTLAKRYGA